MKYPIAIAAGIAGSFFVAQAASAAGGFEDQMGRCLQQFANTRDAAQVMLECTADAGKLTDCKVVDNSAAGKGFDKAAMCIAEKLPMGAKTGTVKVPVPLPGRRVSFSSIQGEHNALADLFGGGVLLCVL
jgi:hypothetical protein